MRKALFLASILVLGFAAPAFALGPVDFEVGASYWLSETEIEVDEFEEFSEEFDSEDLCFWAQVWAGKWGAKGSIYKADLDESEFEEDSFTMEFTALDVRYKLLELSDSNYVAFGAGYQSVDFGLDGEGVSTDSDGWRAVVEGRAGVGRIVSVYGELAYYFGLDDFTEDGEDLTDGVGGWEIEVGVSIKPFPFMNLRVGYRRNASDFDVIFEEPRMAPTMTYDFTPEGFIVGVSVNF